MDKNLKGLVLAGGKSIRMGSDKAKIVWHTKEQQYHLADLLELYCDEVFISCTKKQQSDINEDYNSLPDLYESCGPMGAVLAAFEKYPDKSWLILACDLPLLDEKTLDFLVKNRENSKIATAFESPSDHSLEPLIAIWEPESYNLIKTSYQKKQFSLRKVLLENQIKKIKAPDIDALINANTPEESACIVKLIALKSTSFIR